MSEPVDPQWELLPRDPAGFFGLSAGYDLRELKRSYNQLLRRFKPEKCPQEFQRIRAAYESLNDALRFHLPAPGSVPSPFPLEPLPPSPGQSPRPARSERPDLERPAPETVSPPAEALRVKPPAELYRELQSKSGKSPVDFIALAFLSDSVAPGAAPAFFEWLLAGLKAHPQDWGLTQLVREYLSEPHSLPELATLLRKVVDVMPADRFQYTTERAWDRLLRDGSFADFGDCVRACGERLGRAAGTWQAMFFVHVLRMAMWKGEDDFLSDLRNAVDDQFHALEGWTRREYETTSLLLDYQVLRAAFIARGPACQRIDEAIRDWCLLPEARADLSVLDCCYFVSQRGHRLLEEFPDPQASLAEILVLWELIAADVLERQAELVPPEDLAIARDTRDFMARINRRHHRTAPHYQGLAVCAAALAILLVTLAASASLVVRLGWKLLAEGRILSGLLDGSLGVMILLGGSILALIIFHMGCKISKLRYDPVRGELIKLLRVLPLPVDELVAAILQREDEKFGAEDYRISDTKIIARGLQQDPAIAIFSLAQVGLRAATPEPIVDAVLIER